VPVPPRSARMVHTARRVGWDVRMLGLAVPQAFNFQLRMRMYADTLRSERRDRLVVLSDANDVLVLRSPAAFADAFAKTARDARLLASMELICFGRFSEPPNGVGEGNCVVLKEYWDARGGTRPPRQFVNAGLVAGAAGDLLDWLEWSLARDEYDDQMALARYMNAHPDRVAADVDADVLHSSVFAVTSGLSAPRHQCHDAPTYADTLGCGAFFLHIPGTSPTQAALYDMVAATLERGPKPAAFRAMSTPDGEGPLWRHSYYIPVPLFR